MSTKKTLKVHTAEFKAEALKLADKIGVAAAASCKAVRISALQLAQCRTEEVQYQSEREAALAAEVARLKRQLAEQTEDLAILKKAATYFAKNQR